MIFSQAFPLKVHFLKSLKRHFVLLFLLLFILEEVECVKQQSEFSSTISYVNYQGNLIEILFDNPLVFRNVEK